MPNLDQSILENLDAFTGFVRKRVGDEHLAADLVQDSLLKALAAERQPKNSEDSIAWFYRILRRSIIDLYRRNDARKRALDRFQAELSDSPTVSERQVLCQCFVRLLPTLPVQYRKVLQQIDLEQADPARVAAELGLTRNNLTVRLHRARKQLRVLLSKNCRACSKHGCLDCTCQD